MNRRDIIIISALVNVAVLAVLFMTAVNNDDVQSGEHYEISSAIIEKTDSTKRQGELEPLSISDRSADEYDSVFTAYDPSKHPINDLSLYEEPGADIERELASFERIVEEQQEPEQKFVEITIKRGDSLEKIARTNGTTVQAIKAANHMKNDTLILGKTIRVPLGYKNSKTLSQAKQTAPTPNKKPEYYTVENGDNPWKIAKKFHLNLDDLLRLNEMDEDSARRMRPGDTLRIR